jgi:UDP-2,4-diacetamido-2,4,6-trideoxy-beta-L-altropyranose hydrolase
VDASPDVGLGHLMRCLALAQGLVERAVRVIFVMTELSAAYAKTRQDWVGEVQLLPEHEKNQTSSWLSTYCKEAAADWLILDGYHFDFFYREKLLSDYFKLAMFDDGQLIQSDTIDQNVALLINSASGAEKLAYKHHAPNAQLCIGDKYHVLRQEFSALTVTPFIERNGLVLMFGGSDPCHLTLPLLQLLSAAASDIPITVVTGAGYARLPEFDDFIEKSHLSIKHIHDCQNIAQVMVNARLVISAAGGSQFELLCCATPSVLVVVADNQKYASKQANKQGWCQVLEYDHKHSDDSLQLIKQIALDLWQQPKVLNDMCVKAQSLSNQSGLQRIFQQLYLP